MLVLSRKLGEKIVIDGDIEVQVIETSGTRVRLGISAPDDCRITRAELRSKAVVTIETECRQSTVGNERQQPAPRTSLSRGSQQPREARHHNRPLRKTP